jgi:radical SAM superfamily enzyme YgiQ (UPF0313 family)
MRVLLVNSNRKGDLLAAPPLGLCYVAGAAEFAGHEVSVLDLCFAPHNVKKYLTKAIQSFQPEVVGLSIRNIDNVNMLHPISYIPEVLQICNYIREIVDVPIVIGGTGASLMPENILRFLKADYIVVADGEAPFVALLNALENKQSLNTIPGVGFLVKDRFRFTEPTMSAFESKRPDLGRWIDTAPYQKIGSSYNIQTKRGCNQRCVYCTYNQALEGNKIRLRNPVDVVDEIEEAIEKYKPKTFEFVDSVFNEPIDHSAAILEEIIRRDWSADFTAMGVHPRGLDRTYLDLMWRAGFRSFMITPESASGKMLRSYGKGFTQDEVIHAAEAINMTQFAAWWFFMIGGPGEDNKTLQESLDFALTYLQKNGRPVTHIAHFFTGVRIYPGTKLWNIATAEGFVPSQADPLQNLWYISEDLDLDLAVEQMMEAARRCPEVYLGFDERVLMFSKIAASIFSFLKLPRPYWRYFRAANNVGLATGMRFMFRPGDIAGMIRSALKKQGYRGKLVNEGLTVDTPTPIKS